VRDLSQPPIVDQQPLIVIPLRSAVLVKLLVNIEWMRKLETLRDLVRLLFYKNGDATVVGIPSR
jgi:hypothetical protein